MEDTDVTTATAPTPDSAPAGAVLAALDGSPADGPILDWAADEAARLGAQLRMVTAVDPGIQLTPYDAIVTGAPSLSEQLEADAQRLLEAAAERVRARHPGLHVATWLGGFPGMSSVLTHVMEKQIAELDIPSIPEFVEMIADTGAGMYACKASVDLFKMEKADFIDQVDDIITVGEFYEIAAGGHIIFT
mgnify:CR=1 FL=1